MSQNFIFFISRFASLNDEELNAFLAIFKPITISKHDHLFLE